MEKTKVYVQCTWICTAVIYTSFLAQTYANPYEFAWGGTIWVNNVHKKEACFCDFRIFTLKHVIKNSYITNLEVWLAAVPSIRSTDIFIYLAKGI